MKDPAAWAVSFIVVGLIITALVVITWWKGSGNPASEEEIDLRAHLKKIAFGLCMGGVFLGLGIGYLADIPFLQFKLGFIAVWIPVAMLLGYVFGLEWRGFKNHHVRTPIIGALTAALIFIAAGHAVLNGINHEVQHVQTTAKIDRGKG